MKKIIDSLIVGFVFCVSVVIVVPIMLLNHIVKKSKMKDKS